MIALKLLVTGAGGLLGSAVAKIASERHSVFSGFRRRVPKFGEPVAIDLLNLDRIQRVVRTLKPDAILHAAALTDVDRCEAEKRVATRVNYEATKVISAAAARAGAYFLYMSTDAVFDGERGMYRETDRPNPINHYGLTKLMGEEAVRAAGVKSCIARSSVIYGSRPAALKDNFAIWLIEKLTAGHPVNIVTDQFVSPSLNSNVAEMVLELTERSLTGTYHASGASRVSRYDFAGALAATFRLDASLIRAVRMKDMKWTAPRPRDSSLDVSKATRTLKHVPLPLGVSLVRLKTEYRKEGRTGRRIRHDATRS